MSSSSSADRDAILRALMSPVPAVPRAPARAAAPPVVAAAPIVPDLLASDDEGAAAPTPPLGAAAPRPPLGAVAPTSPPVTTTIRADGGGLGAAAPSGGLGGAPPTCGVCAMPVAASDDRFVRGACAHVFHATCMAPLIAGGRQSCAACPLALSNDAARAMGGYSIDTGNDAEVRDSITRALAYRREQVRDAHTDAAARFGASPYFH